MAKLKPITLFINVIGFFIVSIFSNYTSTFGRFVGGIVIFLAFLAAKTSTFSKLLLYGLKMLWGGYLQKKYQPKSTSTLIFN